jgi:hybrid cluster-associated redox disulfide protein
MLNKDTVIIDLLQMGDVDKIADVLYGFGMHCLGCALSRGETIGQAALAHGVDVDEMIAKLNEVINK